MPEIKKVKPILKLDTLAAGATTNLKDCEILDLSNVETLTLTIEVTHNSSATKAVLVNVYTSDAGGDYDTTPYTQFEAHLVAGSKTRKTVAILPDAKYMAITLTNQDATYPATNIRVFATLGYEKVS